MAVQRWMGVQERLGLDAMLSAVHRALIGTAAFVGAGSMIDWGIIFDLGNFILAGGALSLAYIAFKRIPPSEKLAQRDLDAADRPDDVEVPHN